MPTRFNLYRDEICTEDFYIIAHPTYSTIMEVACNPADGPFRLASNGTLDVQVSGWHCIRTGLPHTAHLIGAIGVEDDELKELITSLKTSMEVDEEVYDEKPSLDSSFYRAWQGLSAIYTKNKFIRDGKIEI